MSLDTKTAFDPIGMRLFSKPFVSSEFLKFLSNPIRYITLVGYVNVEVNGRRGILITIKTGSRQGDPLSSVLLLDWL
jgi:hypothetical protein